MYKLKINCPKCKKLRILEQPNKWTQDDKQYWFRNFVCSDCIPEKDTDLTWFEKQAGGQINLSLFNVNVAGGKRKLMIQFEAKIRNVESVQGVCRYEDLTELFPKAIEKLKSKIGEVQK